jgi:hypothetical protein
MWFAAARRAAHTAPLVALPMCPPPMRLPPFIPALALTLVISWGSLYYAFALLARPMQAELQASSQALMGAYSLGLLVWGLATGAVGALLPRIGGRVLMTAGSLLAGVMFLALGRVDSVAGCCAVWCGLGLAMAMTLYEPAFAIVVRACPADRRRAITVLALAGGLASSVFWPLTAGLVDAFGWRGAATALALLQLLVCAPLHAWLLPGRAAAAAVPDAPPPGTSAAAPAARRVLALLALAFSVNGFVTAALAMHVIPLLESRGAAPGTAVLLAACIGPMQVTGRALEFLSGGALTARRLGLLALGLIPLALGALWLAAWQPLLCGLFIAAYGAGLGLMTIVRATTPLALFGPERYAALSGALGTPALLARAAGPLGAAWLLGALPSAGSVLLLLAAAAALATAAFLHAWTIGARTA